MFVLELGPEAHLEAYGGALRECRLGDTTLQYSPSALLQLSSIFQKGEYTLVWSNVIYGTHPDHLVWWPAGFILWSHSICICILKSCYLKVWFPISLTLGAKIPYFRADRTWQTPNNGSFILKNKIGCLENHKGSRDYQELDKAKQ